jgi:UDP-N-acetylglucosamine 2-epimerase (non-hydrolysing)
MSPVIRALRETQSDHFVLHTGQHYSYKMDKVFFENLELGPPDVNLNIGSGSHAEETGRMLIGIEKVLVAEKATGLLVEGDTNTVLAGALAGAKLNIRVGHVEAGLRSGDRLMPEEINRIVADHVADSLFAPTKLAKANLIHEGVKPSGIFVTGNTIVDAVKQNLNIAKKSDTTALLDGAGSEYLLATLHRQENVDDAGRLARILKGLELVAQRTGLKVLYPAHPRAKKAMRRYGVNPERKWVKVAEPVDYLTFLKLESRAELILTDSGGVQEEACILGVPCVTLRENTERPETIEVGANRLAGSNPRRILSVALRMLRKRKGWPNPFGDGRAGKRIFRKWTEARSSSG